MRTLCLLLLATCLVANVATVRGQTYAPQVGEPHPEFTLPSIADGRPISLSQYRGTKVLLIHFASW